MKYVLRGQSCLYCDPFTPAWGDLVEAEGRKRLIELPVVLYTHHVSSHPRGDPVEVWLKERFCCSGTTLSPLGG